MSGNYTVVDVLATAKAAAFMSLVLFVPGYVIGWCFDVLDFRKRRPILRVLMSVPLAIASGPVLTYLLARLGYPFVWMYYGATWAGFVGLVANELWRGRSRRILDKRYIWISGIIVATWLLLGTASLVDLQLGNRLYFSVPAYDYSVRTAFTAAVARAIPPSNPFFNSVPPVPLRYHYFWLVLCSLATKMAGVAPRPAMFGATLWCGLGLISLVAVYVKFFLRPQANLERKALVGVGLLLVTGLDIIPTIILSLQTPPRITPDMEWWNAPQITSWVDSMIWVPHHVAALIACLTGFLILHIEKKRRVLAVAIAGISFGSAAGLSVYVTFTFGIFMAGWVVFCLRRQDRRDMIWALVAAGVALCCAIPYLLTLVGSGRTGNFITFHVRQFTFMSDILRQHGFRRSSLAVKLLLPLNYFLELGFFLLVGLDRLRKVRKAEVELTPAAWAAVGASFLVGTFIQSTTIANNDLGYRCFLLAQFVLLLWAVPIIDGWLFSSSGSRDSNRSTVRLFKPIGVACLLLGLVGTMYQVVELRLFPIWADHSDKFARPWLDGDGQLGKRTYALREAYEKLNPELNQSGVIQFNPMTLSSLPHLLYSDHPAAAVGPNCGTEFGGRQSDCVPRIQELSALFGSPSPEMGAQVNQICARNGIDVLLVKDTDPAWKDRRSWVWTEQPMFTNAAVRAFWCGTTPPRSSARAALPAQ